MRIYATHAQLAADAARGAVRENVVSPPVVIEQVTTERKSSLQRHPICAASVPLAGARGGLLPLGPQPGLGHGPGSEERADSATTIEAALVLPPGSGRRLEIDYTANSLSGPERIRFKYRLAGHDRNWTDAGTARRAYYSNLHPGDYRFEVMACNNHNVWNETGPALALTVLPYFYETWSFRAGCVAAGLLLAWAFYRWRVKELRRIPG